MRVRGSEERPKSRRDASKGYKGVVRVVGLQRGRVMYRFHKMREDDHANSRVNRGSSESLNPQETN